MIDITQNMDIFVEVSGLLKSYAVNLNKIANDLRLLSSGPNGGIAEIKLPEVQAGSSIMPGKVNPVICEMINQVSIEVITSDQAVTLAARDGQLELNAFTPIIAHKLLNMIELMNNAVKIFIEKCISGIRVNKERTAELLNSSLALVTALVPYLGYDKAVELAHQAKDENKQIKELIIEKRLFSETELNKILSLERLTRPGVNFD
jgi:aspartate ammonia-lyase